MKKRIFMLTRKLFSLQTLCSVAIIAATAAANSRCAYIYHNPDKPDELQRLKKY